MTRATYKSTRLLVEAVNQEMESVRKAAMGNMALGSLNELRDLVAQLAKKAERVSVEDVQDLPPDQFVATMKPLVANFHRILVVHDLLANCLCEDLRLPACVVILVGDDGSRVRAAHDPNRPDAALIVETLIASLEGGTKQVAVDAEALVAEATGQPGGVPLCGGCDCVDGECSCTDCEGFSGIARQVGEPLRYESTPLTLESIEKATEETLRRGEESVDYMPCQGPHDEPCGDPDCYVLASIRRNKRGPEL